REERAYHPEPERLVIAKAKAMALVIELLGAGWRVAVDGRAYLAPGAARATVRSGIDWFDLEGGVSYGGVEVPLADLLEAHRRGDESIELEDGSRALLPTEWLSRLGAVAAGGDTTNGAVRFGKTQTALLDALLATLPNVDV